MKVSVITTCYNSERWLQECIDSVLAQQIDDMQYILYDDGSTDGTKEIIDNAAKTDTRIVPMYKKHKGRIHALIEATKNCDSEYMMLVDSDDLLAENAIQSLLSVFNTNPDTSMVYGQFYEMAADGSEYHVAGRSKIPYSRKKLLETFITFHPRLIRMDAFNEIGGYNKKYVAAMDYDLCLRISENHEIVKVEKPLYYYRLHDNRITIQRREEQRELSLRAIEESKKRKPE